MPNSVTINLRVKTAALSELEKVKSKLNGLSTSKGFQNAVMGVGISAGMAAWNGLASAIGGVGQFLGDAIQAASDLEEAQNKANLVFGESSRVIDDFAATSARAWGLSKRAAYEATGTFGNLFSTIGLGKDAAADMSVRVTKLAADLASFNNIGTEEVLANIRSGLVGEAEPLRKFGILLTEANVKAKAMSMGLVAANGVVSEGAKLQARYALILEQSGNAQGDFARTSDGMANTQRSLQAEMEDLSAEIGQALLPVMRDLAVIVRDDVVPIIRTLIDVLKLLTFTMEPNAEATKRVAEAQTELYTNLDLTYSMLQETRPEWARTTGGLQDMATTTRVAASAMFGFGEKVSTAAANVAGRLKPAVSGLSPTFNRAGVQIDETTDSLLSWDAAVRRSTGDVRSLNDWITRWRNNIYGLKQELPTGEGGGGLPWVMPRQHGGPVEAGRAYLVGEGGKAELFVPNQNGMIAPLGRGPSGTPVQNTIVVQVDGRELARVLDERQYWMLQTAPATIRAS